ncbi:hypothetical protein [Paenibacillus crassostreae]|uniref:Uncharacterized protein n=1 Tax=Paenibacillus crassostreae TaxID=1763538 RepID=A0A167FA66_9BACL|nr:hypothetical protein [Paenibacillus crassostreae]OAB76345.1 hypothetical protein PNBC_02710 [Paenibacillus crassostreae]
MTRTETGRVFKNGFEGTHYTVEENGQLVVSDQEKYTKTWYKDWWAKEKDNVLVWSDFYEIYEQQQAAFKQ